MKTMSFGTLCLIGLCGFAGPLLGTAWRGAVPVVVGELLAGIFLGKTGINAIDPGNPTLSFLAEIGFAMLMFAVGMNVPLRDPRMRGSLGKGATSALLVAVIAVGGGLLVARIDGWAVDLRLALSLLFGLAWLTERSGASLLIAGFGAGLMVAAVGGPERLSNEVLGIAGGFFIPLFFVVLGARLDLRGLFSDPTLIKLAGGLAALNVLVHLLAARLAQQPLAAGLVASAQLGVPSAIVALGLSEHVLSASQAGAIMLAALLSISACSVGALRLESSG